MKNPVNLEMLWAAESAKQTKNLLKAQAKQEKANRMAFAAWVAGMKQSGALVAPTTATNPAAVLAAAA